jgi:TRAP-type C4-dicarboxylate transport system substrate-binding protein
MTISRIASICAAAAMSFAAGMQTASAVELVFGAWPPAGDYMNRVALPEAFAGIAKDTNNAVTWKLVPGGQLADPKATYSAVQDGLMQGGLAISTYVPNLVPSLNTIYSTVVFSDDIVAATGAALETFTLNCPSCLEEMKKINAVALGGWTSSPYFLACREPVKNLADLKGKRVRATGGNGDFMQMLGAVPIAATLVEAVGLLQRGGMDCQFGVHAWLKIFSYGDFAKYVTDTPLGLTGPAMTIYNRESWNKLSPDQKKIHLKWLSRVSASVALGQFVKENEAMLAEVKQSKGVQMVPGDAKAFYEVAAKYDAAQRKTNIENAKQFGVKDPEKIIDAYVTARKKWEGLSKDIGQDIDKYAAAIQREVYDKLDLNKL